MLVFPHDRILAYNTRMELERCKSRLIASEIVMARIRNVLRADNLLLSDSDIWLHIIECGMRKWGNFAKFFRNGWNGKHHYVDERWWHVKRNARNVNGHIDTTRAMINNAWAHFLGSHLIQSAPSSSKYYILRSWNRYPWMERKIYQIALSTRSHYYILPFEKIPWHEHERVIYL